MAHGAPDWGQYRPQKTVFPVHDLAELAVRLGSIVSFDRRGDVVWLDDFEDNIAKWEPITQGTGAAIALSTLAARNGAFSAKLTTGAAANDYAQIRKHLPRPVLGPVGFEVSLSPESGLNSIQVALYLYDGTNLHTAIVEYRPYSKDLRYRDSTGTFQTIATSFFLMESVYLFHTFKLVIDINTGYYKRLIVNETEYDLSSYGIGSAASSASPELLCSVAGLTVGTNHPLYVDDAIVTQNEP